jgi:antitoxin component of RelBE/YafQ-DinJ toxin-antitoxin module
MAGRKPLYQAPDEMPASVSLRIPRALYDEAQQYIAQRRMTLTDLLLDGLRLRLDTPADPRDLLLSDDNNTVMQHVQELVNAAVQAALATGYGPPMHTPARTAAALPTEAMPYYNNNTVIQKRAVDPQRAPLAPKRRKDATPDATLRAIAAERKRYPDMSIRAFGDHLFTTGLYRAVGKGGKAKPGVCA